MESLSGILPPSLSSNATLASTVSKRVSKAMLQKHDTKLSRELTMNCAKPYPDVIGQEGMAVESDQRRESIWLSISNRG